MDSASFLGLAIRFGFFYLGLALICCVVNEIIARIVDSRGRTLEKGILRLLHDSALKARFYDHPLIQGIQEQNNRLPSYIASNEFALTIMDILTGPAAANDPEALRKGVANLDGAAKTALTAVLQNPRFVTDYERIEAWFERDMDQVSGWYRRSSQIRVFVLAAVVTVLLNADTFKIFYAILEYPTLTALLMEDAKAHLQAWRPDAQARAMSTADNDVTLAEKPPLGRFIGWGGRLVHRLSGALHRWILALDLVSAGKSPWWMAYHHSGCISGRATLVRYAQPFHERSQLR